ncbi:hypothetical protein BJX99DRAFT_258336 [Aspergillus californicus]
MPNWDTAAASVPIVATVLLPLAFVVVVLRCYVRGLVTKGFGWDDGFMVLAMLCHIGFSTCIIAPSSENGFHNAVSELAPPTRVRAMKFFFAGEVTYSFASLFCRISISIFLLRIVVSTVHIRVIQAVMVLSVLVFSFFFVVIMLQCTPISFFWMRVKLDRTIKGSCHDDNTVVFMYTYSALVSTADLTLAILPVFIVWNLQMPRPTKVAVAAILGLGGLASAATIARIPSISTYPEPGSLHALYDFALWSVVELGIGIIASSLATLGPLFRACFGICSHNDHGNSPRTQTVGGRRRRRRIYDLSIPLTTIGSTLASAFRPDKVSTTVTSVQVRRDLGGHDNDSQEFLTSPRGAGSSVSGGSVESRGTGGTTTTGDSASAQGIYRSYQMTQTWDVEVVDGAGGGGGGAGGKLPV